MIRLRGVGFFRELQADHQGPSLHDAMSAVPHPDAQRIVAYLRGGTALCGVAGYVTDVIDPTITGLTKGVMTDGVYAWPNELPHYVEAYHAKLPEDFVAHLRANDWRPPAEGSIELDDWAID